VLLGDEDCEQQAFESVGEATGSNSFGNAANVGPGNSVRIDPRGKRRWQGTVALAATPGFAEAGRPWQEAREAVKVDGRPLTPPPDKLPALLRRPDWTEAEFSKLTRNNGFYSLEPSNRLAPTPWLPLLVLHPANERRFSFVKAGEERVGKVPTWKLSYRERLAPTLLSLGENSCGATGTFWILPSDGRVVRAELQCVDIVAPDWVALIKVTYQRDEGLGFDVPVEMTEQPEADSGREWLGRRGKKWVEGRCRYSHFRQDAR
jgi:hypothetical protein